VKPFRVGPYRVFEPFAFGGMGSVHWGRDDADRIVAIKRHRAHLARTPEYVAMISAEARLSARIRHPNVVSALDVVAQEHELLLVMPYVAGVSLAELWRRLRDRGETIPAHIACAILIDVLEGLHAAHEARDESGLPLGIVHCDVSPQNVLIGADGVSKITDFALACARGSPAADALKGKLGYRASEQIRGEPLDARTDVYSASVVLWEALAGRRAFDADDAGVVFARVLAGELEPPSRFAPDVDPGLDFVVMRGLSYDPDARFESARAMADALCKAAPVASPIEVSEWLHAVAGKELRRRAARRARVAAYEDPSSADAEVPTRRLRVPMPPSVAPTSLDVRARAPDDWAKLALQKLESRLKTPLPDTAVLAALAAGVVCNLFFGFSGLVVATHGQSGGVPDGAEGGEVVDVVALPAAESVAEPPPTVTPDDARGQVELLSRKNALKTKVFHGKGTPDEIRLLHGLCRQLGDSSCMN
jgi:serine/threonine protein kinase